MGSVGLDYKCPHCDGIGFGGYAMDGINYPICTVGITKANCLDKALECKLTSGMAVQKKTHVCNVLQESTAQRVVLVQDAELLDRVMEFM